MIKKLSETWKQQKRPNLKRDLNCSKKFQKAEDKFCTRKNTKVYYYVSHFLFYKNLF